MRDFDLKQMERRCLAPITGFLKEGKELLDWPGNYLIFRDNGCKVLGVAHLDSVQDTTHFETVTIRKGKKICQRLVFNGQLDDRLGAYLLLDYLPQLGLEYDILLTEDEEFCASTAMFFDPPRDYNWMFSFDREGEDVVLYEYEWVKEFAQALRGVGFRINDGSYSDIRELEHLGCCGFNVGTGLRLGHDMLAYTDLLKLRRQVEHFQRFYRKYRNTHFEYAGYSYALPQKQIRTSKYKRYLPARTNRGYSRNSFQMYDDDTGQWNYERCSECWEYFPVGEMADGLCEGCIAAQWFKCEGCDEWTEGPHTESAFGPLCKDCVEVLEEDSQPRSQLTLPL